MIGRPFSKSKLSESIAGISNLPREELVSKWEKVFKHPPPKAVKRSLLERGIAYQLQTRKLGGLKPETRRTFQAIATGNENEVKVASSSSLRPGTRLVREWHGKPYQVNITETGYEWDGEVYSSLSAIAKAITGAKWSGPRFFGL